MGNVTTWDFIVRLLYILGGLGIFLFGMRVMSEGIQKVFDRRSRRRRRWRRFNGSLTKALFPGMPREHRIQPLLLA